MQSIITPKSPINEKDTSEVSNQEIVEMEIPNTELLVEEVQEIEIVEENNPKNNLEDNQKEEIVNNVNEEIKQPEIIFNKKQVLKTDEIDLENMEENQSITIDNEIQKNLENEKNIVNIEIQNKPNESKHYTVLTKQIMEPESHHQSVVESKVTSFKINKRTVTVQQSQPNEIYIDKMQFGSPEIESSHIKKEIQKNSSYERSNDGVKHVVRYKVSSPEPSKINSRFQNAPLLQEFRSEEPKYISEKVNVYSKVNPPVYETLKTTKVYKNSENENEKQNKISFGNKNYNYNEIKNSIKESVEPPVFEEFKMSSLVKNPVVVKNQFSNRLTLPADTKRTSEYSRRFKHLKLVENTKDYKRFQYTTKSREKVTWSWVRNKEPGKVTKKSNLMTESNPK